MHWGMVISSAISLLLSNSVIVNPLIGGAAFLPMATEAGAYLYHRSLPCDKAVYWATNQCRAPIHYVGFKSFKPFNHFGVENRSLSLDGTPFIVILCR